MNQNDLYLLARLGYNSDALALALAVMAEDLKMKMGKAHLTFSKEGEARRVFVSRTGQLKYGTEGVTKAVLYPWPFTARYIAKGRQLAKERGLY